MNDQAKTVVATCGGFDPVHIGHIRLFKEARELGDRLVVILNQDKFLLAKKGYVFMPFPERKEILESIRYIDEIVEAVDEDQTVAKTLELVKPHILAKGGDRKPDGHPIPASELAVCQKYDIKIQYGIGGTDKPQSSSWLVNAVRGQPPKTTKLYKRP